MVEYEHFFLADTEQIVVEGCAFNNRPGRALEAAGVIHQYRRISRAGTNGALARLHRGLDDGRPAGDEQQTDVLVLTNGGETFERRLFDDANNVLNAGFAI